MIEELLTNKYSGAGHHIKIIEQYNCLCNIVLNIQLIFFNK